MRLLLGLILPTIIVLAVIAADRHHAASTPPPRPLAELLPPSIPETTTSTATTTTTAPPLLFDVAPTVPVRRLRVSSTAYCETGSMANGKPAHDGAVSSNFLPRGSRWRVLTGPYAGRVFTVEDTGSLALFDIAIPGGCHAAEAYGRRPIEIEAA